MTKTEIIKQLEDILDYTNDHISLGDCDDIWFKDAEVLNNAILLTKMFFDMIENLDGQCLLGEMVAILGHCGYNPQDFSRLDICTEEQAAEYIEYFNS